MSTSPYYATTDRSVTAGRSTVRAPQVVVGAVLGHMLAVGAAFMVGYLIYTHYRGSLPPNHRVFHSFGMHPIFMASAFLFLSPLGALSYKTYEHVLGVKHGCAKLLHALFQTLALVCGILGFVTMWNVHKGGVHFQTAHSWIGAFGLGLFALQWLVGFLVYLLPKPASVKARARLMPVHVFVGGTATMLTMVSCATGVLALVWKPTAAGGSTDMDVWRFANMTASVIMALLVVIMFVYYEAGRLGFGKSPRMALRR